MNGQFRLWTPVANALEAYRRRVLFDPDATYEHIWRLIHIHEALVATLGAALSTRLLQEWQSNFENEGRINRLRSMITGLSETDDEATPQSAAEFCFSGSIKAWIDILQVFGKSDSLPTCGYCDTLCGYLTDKTPERALYFLDAWKRIAPVPPAYSGVLPRVQRFDAINALRNKLAHVPLPERILSDLHRGVRAEILGCLSPKYDPEKDSVAEDFRFTQWHQALCGRILTRGFYVTGSDIGRAQVPSPDENTYVWLQPMPLNESGEPVSWRCDPFFSLDGECKVSLVFRIPEFDVTGESVPGEYHRFAAEFEPVQKISISTDVLKPWVPQPTLRRGNIAAPSEVSAGETAAPVGQPQTGDGPGLVEQEGGPRGLDGTETPEQLRTLAENAFRRREYGLAVTTFEALAAKNVPIRYNDVAKSKHGAALWRFAVLTPGLPQEDRIKKIESSLQLLEQAAKHVDPRYRARAQYEMSKAHYHLWKLTSDYSHLESARESAEMAAKTDFDAAYITWVERVQEEVAE